MGTSVATLSLLVDWADGSDLLSGSQPFEGDLSRPQAWLSDLVERTAAHSEEDPAATVGLLGLAIYLGATSAAEATRVRGLLADELWCRAIEDGAARWILDTGLVPRVGSGRAPSGPGPEAAIGRWLIVPAGVGGPACAVVPGEDGRTLVWSVAALDSLPAHPLIGLPGLKLVDLGGSDPAAATTVELPLPRLDRMSAIVELVDAAVDLGIAIGFVEKVGEYSRGDSGHEPVALERLGEALAVLGALSEGLREGIESAPDAAAAGSDWRRWRERCGAHRALGEEACSRILSELFEIAGARSTSGRFGLDAGFRDLSARRAAFPSLHSALPRRNEQEQ